MIFAEVEKNLNEDEIRKRKKICLIWEKVKQNAETEQKFNRSR